MQFLDDGRRRIFCHPPKRPETCDNEAGQCLVVFVFDTFAGGHPANGGGDYSSYGVAS